MRSDILDLYLWNLLLINKFYVSLNTCGSYKSIKKYPAEQPGRNIYTIELGIKNAKFKLNLNRKGEEILLEAGNRAMSSINN